MSRTFGRDLDLDGGSTGEIHAQRLTCDVRIANQTVADPPEVHHVDEWQEPNERDRLIEAFATFPARFAEAARVAADLPVTPGEWGPSEVGRHLVAVELVVWHARFEEIATQDDPHWSWTEPGPSPALEAASLEAVLAMFAQVRARSVATVRAFDDAGWARTGTHATEGVLDVAGLLRMASDHDEEHLLGIARPD